MDPRQRLQALIKEAEAIQATATAAKRDLTADELASINSKLSDVDTLKAQIETLDRLEAAASTPLPRTAPASARQTEFAREGAVDPTGGFAHFGEFASAIFRASTPDIRVEDKRLLPLQAAATGLNQGTGAEGGYTVPPEYRTQIWDGLADGVGQLLPATDQYLLDSTASITFNANAETSRVDGSRFGGIAASWISEADAITASKPQIRQLTLTPNEVAALCYVTDKLLRNSAALGSFLTRAATEEIAFVVNDAIFRGNGSGKPTGITGHAATVVVAKESGQAAATILTENLVKMWARCHVRARRNAVWYINQDIEPQLMLLKDAAGNAIYLPPGGLSASPFGTLFGRPVIPIEYSSTLGTVGDITLGNFGYYATALRGYGLQQAASMHLRFNYAETAFRFIFEVDGKPWLGSALTPFKGSNTLSPFVQLATRA